MNRAIVALVAIGLLSCDHSPTAPRLDQLALEVVSGNGQTAVVGTPLAPLVVKVTSAGNPVVGQILNFRVTSGGGSVYGGTELTDNDGIAQELWTLGTNASEAQKVEVRAVESSTGAQKVFAAFTATALADKPESLFVQAGNNQTAPSGTAVSTAPTVEISDKYGNPIAGVTVIFAVASGGGGATGLSQVTNTAGLASVGTWILGTRAGPNTLLASTPTVSLSGSPVTFTAFGTTGSAARFVFLSGNNQSASPGATLPQNPAVQVLDANGNGVPDVAVTFTVRLGGGSIDGVGSVTTLTSAGTSSLPAGAATVNWTLGSSQGANTLQATAEGLSGSPLVFSATATYFAYVANSNSGTVSVIATVTNTPVATVSVGSIPWGAAITPNGAFAYVTNQGSGTVSVIATATNNVVATVPVGSSPAAVAITPDGAFAYVTSNSNTVSVIATATNTVVATVSLGSGTLGVAITPDGAFAYVPDAGSSTVSVIATATNTVVTTVNGVGTIPFGVAITPDGAYAYVTNQGSNTVSVIATATNTVVSTVPVGSTPSRVAITPDGSFAYVTNQGSNTVSVISTATNAVVATVNAGSGPWGVAFTPDGAFAYVTNFAPANANTVSVIATATNALVATVGVGSNPLSVAITPGGR